MILLTVWGNPVVWKRPGINTKTGHIYDQQSKEKAQYRWQIASQATIDALKVPLEVEIIFYMPIPKSTSKVRRNQMLSGMIHHIVKPDVDNLQKHILDCMTGIIYADDAQITKITAVKCYSDAPRTTICVHPVVPGQPSFVGIRNDCD